MSLMTEPFHDEIERLDNIITALKARIEKLEEALDWYADQDNTIVVSASFNGQRSNAHVYIGERARKALEE